MKIEDVVRGQYIRSPDGTESSYLQTTWGEHVTRVRVLGTVIDKFIREDQNYAILRIDDGSETVGLRAWQEGVKELDRFKVGDTVDVIGRVREFGGEIYLIPELMVPVEDPNWELVRELEVILARRRALARGVRPQQPAELAPVQTSMPIQRATGEAGPLETAEEEPPLPAVPDEIKKKVALAIGKLDAGSGAEPGKISTEMNLDINQVNDALRVMFVEGEVFEPASGKFKLTR